jgi:hypothetical protein
MPMYILLALVDTSMSRSTHTTLNTQVPALFQHDSLYIPAMLPHLLHTILMVLPDLILTHPQITIDRHFQALGDISHLTSTALPRLRVE